MNRNRIIAVCLAFLVITSSIPLITQAAKLPSNSGGEYTVPAEKPILNDLICNDIANASKWSIQNNLAVDDLAYGDNEVKMTQIPAALLGSSWIQTADASKSFTGQGTLAEFRVYRDGMLYIALPSDMKKPVWMNDYAKSALVIETGSVVMNLYEKTMESGAKAELKAAGLAQNYIIIYKTKTIDLAPPVPSVTKFSTSDFDTGWYRMETNLQPGACIYSVDYDPDGSEIKSETPNNYLIKTLPEKFIGSDYVISRKKERRDVFFFAEQDIDVYAALDAGYGSSPGWATANGFTKTADTMTTRDNTLYNIFKKSYQMGDIVLIKKMGNNNDTQRNFFVMILPKEGLPVSKALTDHPVLPEGTRNPAHSSDQDYQYYINDVFNKDVSNGVPTGYTGTGGNSDNTISISQVERPVIAKTNLAWNCHYTVNHYGSVNNNPINSDISTQYWISNGFPGELTVDLGSVKAVNQVTLKVPPSWSNRTQEIEILGSTDGNSFTSISSAKEYEFIHNASNQEAGNTVDIKFTTKTARYIKARITKNTGAEGAQVGRIEIYGPDRNESVLPAGTNLALGCPFQVNGDKYRGESPVDGDPTTYWCSNSASAAIPGILTVDLQDALTINRISLRLWPRWGNRTQDLEIRGSEDGITYQTIEAAKIYSFTAWDNTVQLAFADTKVRYLRVVGTKNTGDEGIQIGELEAYGPAQTVTYTGGRWAILDKADWDADALKMEKVLNAPADGKIILETRVKSSAGNQTMDIPVVKGVNGKTAAAVSFGKDGMIKAVSAGAVVDLVPYQKDNWYNIKLVMDTKTQTYDVWIDHLRKASGIAFAERTADIKAFAYSIARYASGTLNIDYLKLYDDTEVYTVLENFNSVPTGGKPDGWRYSNNVVISVSEVPFKEDKSLEIENIGTPVKAEKQFDPISGDITIEAKIKPINSGWATVPLVMDSSGKTAAKVAIYRNSFFISNGDNWVYVCDQEVPNNYYEAGNWFHLKLVMNTDTNRYDFYIDGAKRYSDASFTEKVDSISRVIFGVEQENVLYINSVKVYNSASLSRGLMPKENVFNVKNFGAAGDGITDDTIAIAKAVKAASYTGGTVLLENGVFYTGQITLENDMTLFIDSSAEIFAKMDRNVYNKSIPSDGFNGNRQLGRGIIYFQNAKNIKITGGGTINGNGFYAFNQNDPPNQRPCILYFTASEDVTVENINMVQSPFWTLVPYESRNITIRNVNITNHVSPNRDGIDPVNSSNLTVEGCKIIAGDDAFCLKSGNQIPSYNVEVRNCFFQSDCNGIKFGTDTQGPLKNYLFEDICMKKVGLSGITIQSMDGSEIENISFKRIDMNDVDNALFVCIGNRYRGPVPNPSNIKNLGYIRDIVFEDINYTDPTDHPYCLKEGDDVHEAMLIGLDPVLNTINDGKDHRISNVLFKNVYMEMPGGATSVPSFTGGIGSQYPEHPSLGLSTGWAYTLRWTDNIRFENCTNSKLNQSDARQEIARADHTDNEIREPAKVNFVLENSDIAVLEGTKQSDLIMPQKARILLETGKIIETAITGWTPITSYEPDIAGVYEFEASLAPDEGIQEAEQLMVSQRVIVRSKAFITQVNPIQDIRVKKGTLARDLSLPDKAAVTLSDGSVKEASLQWESSQYDPQSIEDVVLFGILEDSAEYDNLHNLRAMVKITKETDEETLKSLLKETIEIAREARSSYEYEGAIPSVKISFDQSLNEAERIYSDEDATKAQIDAAWKQLINEIQKLGFQAGDKQMLKTVIDQADLMAENLNRYVDGTAKTDFTAILKEAKGVYDDLDAMQDEISEIQTKLISAMTALRYKADKALLEALIKEAGKIDLSKYTQESVKVFTAILLEAKAVMADQSLSMDDQARVDQVKADLQAAIAQLDLNKTSFETSDPSGSDINSGESGNNSSVPANVSSDDNNRSPETGEVSWPSAVLVLTIISIAGIVLTRKRKP